MHINVCMNLRLMPRLRRRLKVTVGGLQTFTADVSSRGFAAELMQVLRPGTLQHGSIELAGQAYTFTGQVCWAKSGDPRMSVRGRFGVRFTGIANDFYALFQSAWCTPG